MFNLQDATIKSEGGSAIFPLGISENNELTAIEKGVANNDKASVYIKFTFTHADGSKVYRTEFDPTGDPNVEKKAKSIMTRMKHIISKFVDESQFPVANTFEELVDKTIALLNGKTAGVKLRVKTTYTWNDYVGIPNYVPFLEVQTDAPTKLTIRSEADGGIDKMVKDNADDQADVSAQLSAPVAAGAPAQGDANLPF